MSSFKFNNTNDPTLQELKKVIDEQDYYQRLGILPNATQDEIKQAYRKLAKKYHPDRNIGNEEEAAYIMGRISDAYDILSNGESRKKYDQKLNELSNRKTTSQAPVQKNDAYKSYKKSREESEDDFDNDIKNYLNTRRQLNSLYKKYSELFIGNAKYKDINPEYLNESILKNMISEEITKKEINTLLNSLYHKDNIDPIKTLKILFSELELHCNITDKGTGYIFTPNNCILLLIANELMNLIKKYTTDKNNKCYTDILLYLFNKYLTTKQAIEDQQRFDQMSYYTITTIPTYHSLIDHIISPIVEDNMDTITNFINHRAKC